MSAAVATALVSGMVAAPVSVSAAPTPPVPPAVTEAPTEAAALAAAKKSGKRVEVLAKRTEASQVFAEPGGAFTAELGVRPVRARKGTGWAPIDTTLAVSPDGTVAPKAAVADLVFSGGGTGKLATMTRDGKQFSLSWPAPLPKPELAGDTATYREVLPGVDLAVRAVATGFSHFLVVHNAAAAKSPALEKVRFGLSTSELTARVDDGVVSLADAKGNQVFSSAKATMWDSPDGKPALAGAAGNARTAALPVKVDGGHLELTPDRAMLTDPAAKFPLVIDPSYFERRKWDWNIIEEQAPNYNYYERQGTVAEVGYNGETRWRSLFRFDVGTLLGSTISSAKLRISVKSVSPNCSNGNSYLNLHLPGRTPPDATWNSAYPNWGNYVQNLNGCGGGERWFEPTTALNGALQRAADNAWSGAITFGINSDPEFERSNYKNLWPDVTTLVVTYNHAPDRPADLAMVPNKPCGFGPDRTFIATARPQFAAKLSDPNGSNVGARLEIRRRSDGAVVHQDPPGLPPRDTPNGGIITWAPVPEGRLATGVSYTYHAATWDGEAWSREWTHGCEFEVDLGAAGTPLASSLCDPPVCDPERGVPMGSTRSVSVRPAPGDTDVVRYVYGTRQGQFGSTVAAGPDGTATIPITQWTNDPTWLYIKAIDRAGNMSAGTASFDIKAQYNTNKPPGKKLDANGDGTGDPAMVMDNSLWTWSTAPGGAYPPVGTEVGAGVQTLRGDFDGDGLTDVGTLRQEPGGRVKFLVRRGDGNQYLGATEWFDTGTAGGVGWELSRIKPVAADFDGDGKTDIATMYDKGNCGTAIWVFYSEGTRFLNSIATPAWTRGAWCSDRAKLVAGDYDGNGREEIALLYRGENRCDWTVDTFRQDGAPGTLKHVATQATDAGCSDWYDLTPLAGDFDGDGKDDIGHLYKYANNEVRLWTLTSNGNMDGKTFGPEFMSWESGQGAFDWNAVVSLEAANFDADPAEEVAIGYRCCGAGNAALWTLDRGANGRHTERLRWDGAVRSGTGIAVKGASLSGDSRAELVAIAADGVLYGQPNEAGVYGNWGSSRRVAGTSTEPARALFADLDGDGRKEFIYVKPDGALRGYPNVDGMHDVYGTGRKVGEGFPDPARVRFADLNGDGRDDLIRIDADGKIQAWPNVDGMNNVWGPQRLIGNGFPDPARTRFADLNGDGRDEVIRIDSDARVLAWQNLDGINASWAAPRVVGNGFPVPDRVLFGDLNGDGRDEFVSVETGGDVRVWPNIDGLSGGWGPSRVVASGRGEPAAVRLA